MKDGPIELIAQAIHERWRNEQIDAGKPAPSWDELDEPRKESSREHARDIPVKLRMAGCDIAPSQDGDAKDFAFTDEEIETLAIAEHDRWIRERTGAGWTLGEKDVDRNKKHYLVPFEDLPADIAEYDRVFVRAIPATLASAACRSSARPSQRQKPTSQRRRHKTLRRCGLPVGICCLPSRITPVSTWL